MDETPESTETFENLRRRHHVATLTDSSTVDATDFNNESLPAAIFANGISEDRNFLDLAQREDNGGPTTANVGFLPLRPTLLTSIRRNHPFVPRSRASIAYVIVGIFYLLITLLVHYRMNSYPDPKNDENSKAYEFREHNARGHLDVIAGLGPRVVGSSANEKAEKYIMDTVQIIRTKKTNNIIFDVNVQTASGGFTLDFINTGVGQFTSVYQDLKNIVVRISPADGTDADSSVLVNCHYDSVVDSPGAGDDAASCCVMLEIMRSLSQQPDLDLMHNIIFLFNSAEENILQTSHAFITQHHWAPSVKAFVNLDSAGAGGWEIVFQTGPEHPWLIRAYIEAAPYPHASVVGQEIFQTGLVPSDTDFRIFRDYGHIPGIDIAHIKNGYVYHTKNDNPSHIPAGSMQRGGENILATLKNLASSTKLTDPGEDKHGSMVFFDFLGFFMIAYPQRMANILNFTTFVYVYLVFAKKLMRDRSSAALRDSVQLTVVGILVMLTTWAITILVPMGIAVFLTAIGRSLSYYSHNLNIIWLFMLPSVTGALAFHLILKKTIFKLTDVTAVVSMLQDVNMMLWSVIMVAMTTKGLMSAFIPLLLILWPAFCYTVLSLLGFKPTSIFYNLVSSFIPSLFIVYMVYTLLMFLIPIMGRSGLETSPDLLISGLSGLVIMVCLPFQIGFVYTNNRVSRVISTTSAVILLGLAAIIFTPAGFPYSSNCKDPSMQRCMLVHFDRRFHGVSGKVTYTDSSIWYKPMDFLGAQMMEQNAPWLLAKAKKATCDGVYCGRPYLYPFLPHMDARKTFDFPASHLNLTRVVIDLKERIVENSTVRLTFAMTGPSHVTIFISELPLAKVKFWTFGNNIPVEAVTLPLIRYTTFFIYYSHGGPANSTWNFSIDINVDRNKSVNSSLVRMGFAGHYLHGPYQISPDLFMLEQELPAWMTASRWSATYDEYIF